ncbi:hypothetical protein BKP37_10005 [Anaerobacillus alkalilacustris]|uniref:Diguanylate cyclase n=1 Tax=Anaerobacillus alkalilacustris TaxID=393763 RepID=A0A1S2LM49_9BACI|nr:diguanylate cyclase [Anaerobacillus alkalilacustris]OIJ13608.1 hypothetical protein BKP37_10005 [Anaerobacillus alkalilacustris]
MFSNNVSLKRLFEVGVFLLIILIAFHSFLPLSMDKKKHERETAENLENVIALQHLFIEKWLDERENDIRTLAFSPVVKAVDKENMKPYFHTFVGNNADFTSLLYVNMEGIAEFDTSLEEVPYTDVSDREYFIEGKKGNEHISAVLTGRITGANIIVFSAPIYNQNDNFQGLVLGTVVLDTLDELMNRLEIGNTGETFIVDKDGTLITNRRNSLKSVELFEEQSDKIQIPYELLQKAQNNEAVNYYKNYQDETVLGTYKWANNDNWLIIGEIKKSEVFNSFYRMVLYTIFISVTILVIAYIFIVVLYKKISQSIDYVLSGAQLISSKNYVAQIDKDAIKQNPEEFRKLCDVFNEMAVTVRTTIHDLEASEEKLRNSKDYLSLIVETIPNGVVVLDNKGKITFANSTAKKILHISLDEITKRYYNDPEWRITSLDGGEFPDEELPFFQVMKTGKVVHNIVHGLTKNDGERVIVSINASPLFDKNHNITTVVAAISDITERTIAENKLQEANRKLDELSRKDGLTKIANRRHFDETCKKEWQRHVRNGQPLSIILFDIDFFKAYNDTYGHQEGDECLRKISITVENILKRPGDLVARYGGEEFIIILAETNVEGAGCVSERVREEIENLQIAHSTSKVSEFVTVSVGFATTIPDKRASIKELIEKADQALYDAKSSGRNIVKFFEEK